MSGNTQDYYAARGRQARALAAVAVNPEIAAIHRQMATIYEMRAGGTNDNQKHLPAVNSSPTEL